MLVGGDEKWGVRGVGGGGGMRGVGVGVDERCCGGGE